MASAFELFESRIGESSGVFGDTQVTRLFQVTVDAPTDDPKATLRNLRSGGVPLGSLHPDAGRNGIVALMHTRGQRRSAKVWLVIVHYGPPVFFPTERSYWEMAIRGSQDQEFVLHDLDGRPIGNPQFQLGSASGHTKFKTTVLDPGGEGDPPAPPFVTEVDIWMPNEAAPEKRWMNLEGATRWRRGGELLLQRNFATFPTAIDTLLAAVNTINRDSVRAKIADFTDFVTLAPPGHLMLANADVQPMPGVLVGQIIPGRIWQATILFRYSGIPWSPYRRTHTYTTGGKEHAVTFTNAEGIDQASEGLFRLYEEANFTSLLQLFERGASGGQSTIITPTVRP